MRSGQRFLVVKRLERTMIPVLLALMGLIPLASPLRAQLPLSLELHGGLTVPTGDLGDFSGSGMALGADAFFDVTSSLSIYGGWSQNAFPCDETAAGTTCDSDEEFESSGFSAGVRGNLPIGATVRPWASLGALFHDFALESFENDDADVGYEVGLGLEIEVTDMISLGPQARYRTYSIDEDGPEASFFTLEVGGRLDLGGGW